MHYIIVMVVAQSCLTLWEPTNCSLPGSSVHGILQARIEWLAILFSRGSSWPRDQTQAFRITGRFISLRRFLNRCTISIFWQTSVSYFGEGNGNPLQISSLENPMNRGAWWVTVHRVAKSWTWLIDWACTLDICPAVRLLDHMVTLFQFLRKFHIALHSGCTNIHSHQQCRRIPFPPHALKHLWYNIICRLFDMAILTGVTW